MQTLWQDFRYGMRMLLKNPGFTIIAILTLALGIGANTAIFSVVNAVLIRALPYRDADRLVTVWEKSERNDQNVINLGNFTDWKEQNSVFEDMAAFFDSRANLISDGEPEEIAVQFATGNLFSVLGVNAMIGRTIISDDGKPDHQRVVVISYGLWRRRFGGDPKMIGRKLILNNLEATVIGVLPPDFGWHIKKGSMTSKPAELWMAWTITEQMRQRRGRFAAAVARLKPGVTFDAARADMDVISRRLVEQYKEFNTGWGINVVPLRRQFAGEIHTALLVLMGSVAFVLLIACANVANLLLARAAARQKEIAVRAAMGAGRWRIVRQLLTESILLALLGGAAGLVLAWWGTDLLISYSPPELADLKGVRLSGLVLGFTCAISLLTGIIFGLAPAFESSRFNLSETLKETGRSLAGLGRGRRLRSIFVIAEFALAIVLLVGAGLLIRSLLKLQSVETGFNAKQVLTMRVSLPGRRYDQDSKVINFFNQALERIQALPGVESAGAINWMPFAGPHAGTNVEIEGRPKPLPGQDLVTGSCVTDLNFFRTMQIPLKRGRLFTEQESKEMRHVVVINEAFVKKYFQGEEPLGKRVTIYMKNENVPTEIIGIVGDVKHMKLDSEAEPMAYWPIPEQPFGFMTFVIRAKGDATAVVSGARNVIQSLDPQQPVADVRTLENLLANSISRSRFIAQLLGVFSIVAMILAGVGIFGVMAYSVTQRTHEIGVRIALGAQRADVSKLMISQGMKLAMIGVAIGLLFSLALTRLIKTLLFGVKAADPITFTAIALLLILIALLSCYIPARRATKVDPVVALRYE